MDSALRGGDSRWRGREERIRQLEEELRSAAASLGPPSKPGSRGSDVAAAEASKLEEYRSRCRLAEVERDRLSEYVAVVSSRAAEAEAAEAEAGEKLREERRRAARLEQRLEKANITIRYSGDSTYPYMSEGVSLRFPYSGTLLIPYCQFPYIKL